MGIQVAASMDRMGNIIAYPKSRNWRDAFWYQVVSVGGPDDDTVFFQEGSPANDFLENFPAGKRADLENGYDVSFLADPWEVGHWYGYDAHRVAEMGIDEFWRRVKDDYNEFLKKRKYK